MERRGYCIGFLPRKTMPHSPITQLAVLNSVISTTVCGCHAVFYNWWWLCLQGNICFLWRHFGLLCTAWCYWRLVRGGHGYSWTFSCYSSASATKNHWVPMLLGPKLRSPVLHCIICFMSTTLKIDNGQGLSYFTTFLKAQSSAIYTFLWMALKWKSAFDY